ncbi:MAG: hypothetical protein AAF346_00050 [Pseudomonadota bacterium]
MGVVKIDMTECALAIGMGEPDEAGSYVNITMIAFGQSHDDPPQQLTFRLSEGEALMLRDRLVHVLSR